MGFYDAKRAEKEILGFWKKEKIPERIVETTEKKPKFYLLDGPPYVNGVPHVGHLKTVVFKDVWGKLKHMQGHSVWFQPGFDCSGLPIENAVEKKLRIKSKHDIEKKVGIDRFIEECKKLAEGNRAVWMDLYKTLGSWKGWLEPYMTYKNYYLESAWWTIKKLYERGLFVEGHRPGYWCPRCETTLSGYEVTDSYAELDDYSIFVKFPLKGKKNEFLLVWTTTPWTLPSNVSICAHPNEKYVRAEVGDEILILAEKRLDVFTELEMGYTVLETFPGKKLEGLSYEPVLSIPLQEDLKKNRKAHKVILSVPIMKQRVASKTQVKRASKKADEFGHIVTMDTGSGLVHIAPGHGDVDNKIGRHYSLPELSPVNGKGELTKETGEFAGHFVKKADPLIIESLRKTGRLLKTVKIRHSYPLCWRCKTPLIFRMSRQWFLKIESLRKGMMDENKGVTWLPSFAKERFENVLTEAPDWAISRQRYWGITIPLWKCEKCNSEKVIGSREELLKNSKTKLSRDIDLHKNSVDKVRLGCKKCKGVMKRVPHIMDVWFDSGIAPWASLGYPFRNKGLFERLWTVDLVDESLDQIRGWFYSLMVCGFATFKKRPYETVCLNGWTLDEKGEKMSKSLGNVVLAEEVYEKLGADLSRLYYCYDIAPWETQKFSLKSARVLQRVINVLWNTAEFARAYCDPRSVVGDRVKVKELAVEDRWIISKVNELARDYTDRLEKFRFHEAGRMISDFVLNDFSRWYIKLVRDRVSPNYDGPDKEPAQFTVLYSLETVIRLLAPIMPFLTEKVYRSVFYGKKMPASIHFSTWPKSDASLIDKTLNSEMGLAMKLVEAASAARQEKGVRLRWPVESIMVETKEKELSSAVANLQGILCAMMNAKKVATVKGIGKKGTGALEFDHGKVLIGKTMLDEAMLRELVRMVQLARKKQGLHVSDKIGITIGTDTKTARKLKKMQKDLSLGVGAESVSFGRVKGNGKGKVKFQKSEIAFDF